MPAEFAVSAETFFPIKGHVSMVYEYTTSDQDKSEIVEVVFDAVNHNSGEVAVSARVSRPSDSTSVPTSFLAKRTALGVFSYDFIRRSNRMEFPSDLQPGAEWNSNVGIERIETLRGWVVVPAGKFTSCLKVVTRIGGGDLGTAVRYYAPGAGLVFEEIRAEDVQSQLRLVSITRN
ncbi:MAG: hypothetical protein PHW69_04700 [Elusimicrobiaceae bacterium]|nr:hypothetical protein [Elusimicrobiaceae bacterium]